ncbi:MULTISPECIES: extracellular solute-binding protein [Paenibacillus]|uniref:Extracellular solute-binding protein n=1 Tax=Paenibacillus lentus TaxID=1338368 RepID=A0A3Q8S9N1_9BACL|nr:MULTISPECIES: extracellular solute-binding protein [Paenibacillus]AZK45633.1 extracellular solute-binding protein [Paenibacillus lentus]
MKKTFLYVLAAVMVFTLLLSGCGSKDNSSNAGQANESNAPAAENSTGTEDITKKVPEGQMMITPMLIGYQNAEIEITWQPNPSQSLEATSPARVDYLTKKMKAWIEEHPNVKIKPISTSSNSGDNMAKLQLKLNEGSAPDVAAVDSFMMPTFAEYAQPLNDAFAAKGISMDDYFPFMHSTMQPDGPGGDILSDWYTTDVRALYYRKDLIDTPPKTVDELISTAKQLQENNKGMTGLIYVAGRNEGAVNNHLGIYWSQGFPLLNEDNSLAFADGDANKAMLNFLSFFENTVGEGISPQRIVEFDKESSMFGDLTTDKFGMFIASSSAVPQLREIIGADAFDAKWGIAELPVVNAGDTSSSSAGGWTNVVFAKDKFKADLAADFVLSLYSDDSAAGEWCEIGGFLPTRKSVFDTTPAFAEDEYYKSFAAYLDQAQSRPPVPEYTTLSSELQIAIGNIVTGSKTAEQALQEVIKKAGK